MLVIYSHPKIPLTIAFVTSPAQTCFETSTSRGSWTARWEDGRCRGVGLYLRIGLEMSSVRGRGRGRGRGEG